MRRREFLAAADMAAPAEAPDFTRGRWPAAKPWFAAAG